MKILDEYLRLPKGMVDREAEWEIKTQKIYETHSRLAQKSGFELIRYAPLGFSSTFFKGTETARDRAYSFLSKSGKDLMISPDSTASVMREYVSRGDLNSRKIAFITPLVRQRNKNRHYRHYSQLGYALINENSYISNNSDISFQILQLLKLMKEFFDELEIDVVIYVNYFGALRKILKKFIAEPNLSDFLYKIRFSSDIEREEILKQEISDNQVCASLIDLFNRKPQIVKPDVDLKIPTEYKEIYELSRVLKDYANIQILFDPANLHGVATSKSFHFRFTDINGRHLGDGGNYSEYAKNFHEHIKSLFSVAIALEEVEISSKLFIKKISSESIALINVDANADFAINTIKKLESLGLSVTVINEKNKLGKVIKNLSTNFKYLLIIRKEDFKIENLLIENLKSQNKLSIKELQLNIPSNKD